MADKCVQPAVVGLDYAQGHELRAGLAADAARTLAPAGLIPFYGVPVELHLAAMDELGVRRLLTNDAKQAAAARVLGYEVLHPGA